MRTIGEHLKANVSELIAEWERHVQLHPVVELPPEQRVDGLADVLLSMIDAALCAPADLETHRRKVWHAALHGERRRTQGFTETLLLAEFHLIRQAIWAHVRQLDGIGPRAVEVIARIDSAITLAISASLLGYHRARAESLGRWSQSLERIARTSPLLEPSRNGAAPDR